MRGYLIIPAVLAVAVVGTACAGDDEEGNALRPGESAAPSTSDSEGGGGDADLTGVDPCTLVDPAGFARFGPPALPGGGETGTKANTTSFNSCGLEVLLNPEGLADVSITVQAVRPGVDPASTPGTTKAELRGLQVLQPSEQNRQERCDALVAASDEYAVILETTPRNSYAKGDFCAVSDVAVGQIVDALVDGTAKPFALPSNSLVNAASECELITPAVMAAVGATGEPLGGPKLQGCGAGEIDQDEPGLTVSYQIGSDPQSAVAFGDNAKVVEIAGRQAYESTTPIGLGTCSVAVQHIPFGGSTDRVNQFEQLDVTVYGFPPEEACPRAEQAAAAMVPSLPTA